MKRLDRLYEVAGKPSRTVVGLMSGTSVDAIDAVLVRISGHAAKARIEKLRFASFPFPADIRTRINTLFDKDKAMEALLPLEQSWGGGIQERMARRIAAWNARDAAAPAPEANGAA